MSEEDLESGLFAIALSDSEDGATADGKKPAAAARDAQSEEDFQAVKKDYRVKVENGEIWKNINLPLGPKVTKPEAQAVVHAVEELYFFRRYQEAGDFAGKVLQDSDGLDQDTKTLLKYYETKCVDKTGGNSGVTK